MNTIRRLLWIGLAFLAPCLAAADDCPDYSVAIAAEPAGGFSPLLVHFAAVITTEDGYSHAGGSPYRFEWNFGDGGSSFAGTPEHTYSYSAYYYEVSVRVTDPCGRSRSAQTRIRVDRCPSFGLSIGSGVSAGTAPLTVSFEPIIDSMSTPSGPYDVRWDFGDGFGLDEPTPQHTFQSPGNYTVKLEGRNVCGEVRQASRQIVVCPSFVAQIQATTTQGIPPLSVGFSAVSSNRETFGTEYRCEWDFGDGTTAGLAQATHIFSRPGRYEVTLKMTDPCNVAMTAGETITVECPDFAVEITCPQTTGPAPLRTSFGIRIDMPKNRTMDYTYRWDFGDGGEATRPDPEHSFRETGRYVVHLDVTDVCGHVRRAQLPILVECPPYELSIRATPDHGIVPLETSFVALAAPRRAAPPTAEWKFGDGATASGGEVSHRYDRPGTYHVSIEAEDECGKRSRSSAVIEVQELPVVLKMRTENERVSPGEVARFLVSIVNRSSATLADLELTDQLPAGLQFEKQRSDLTFSENGTTLTWRGWVRPDSQEDVEIVIKVKDHVQLGTHFDNEVFLSAPGLDGEKRSGPIRLVVK